MVSTLVGPDGANTSWGPDGANTSWEPEPVPAKYGLEWFAMDGRPGWRKGDRRLRHSAAKTKKNQASGGFWTGPIHFRRFLGGSNK